MYQNCCKKCGSTSLHTEVKGNNTGLYCDDCGAWEKWLSKDELRAFEYLQKKSNKIIENCEGSLIKRIKDFINTHPNSDNFLINALPLLIKYYEKTMDIDCKKLKYLMFYDEDTLKNPR